MSEVLKIGPNEGFVAFPLALFDLDLSPGAFRTLAELCRMANLEGQCWPSLGQLGRKLGRSRGSMSAYVSELRDAGILETEEQKMANGYNYRLRYTLPFWKKWRAQKSKKSVPKTERRVQQAERPLRTKNQIHKIQQSPVDNSFSVLVGNWKAAIRKATYPSFESWPSEQLLEKTKAVVRVGSVTKDPLISADINTALVACFQAKGIQFTPSELGDVACFLQKSLTGTPQLEHFVAALSGIWKDHWTKPPTQFQVARLLKEHPAPASRETEIRLLKSYLKRWDCYCENLPSAAKQSNVA